MQHHALHWLDYSCNITHYTDQIILATSRTTLTKLFLQHHVLHWLVYSCNITHYTDKRIGQSAPCWCKPLLPQYAATKDTRAEHFDGPHDHGSLFTCSVLQKVMHTHTHKHTHAHTHTHTHKHTHTHTHTHTMLMSVLLATDPILTHGTKAKLTQTLKSALHTCKGIINSDVLGFVKLLHYKKKAKTMAILPQCRTRSLGACSMRREWFDGVCSRPGRRQSPVRIPTCGCCLQCLHKQERNRCEKGSAVTKLKRKWRKLLSPLTGKWAHWLLLELLSTLQHAEVL